jgi:prolyl-tRNA editing enzyme YbaK/EbsC (Cys-tRNA(Pro) deacylase)
MDSRQTSSSDPATGGDPAAPAPPILEQIRTLLRSREIEFRELHHEPTRTSEDSARVRGEDLSIGGKALLIKVDDEFRLFVLSAALRVDAQAIRAHLNARRTRFASPEELAQLTGLVPGSVPPFGRPILPFTLYVDPSITGNERIAFNAGSLTDSIFLKVEDYLAVAQPKVFRFGR